MFVWCKNDTICLRRQFVHQTGPTYAHSPTNSWCELSSLFRLLWFLHRTWPHWPLWFLSDIIGNIHFFQKSYLTWSHFRMLGEGVWLRTGLWSILSLAFLSRLKQDLWIWQSWYLSGPAVPEFIPGDVFFSENNAKFYVMYIISCDLMYFFFVISCNSCNFVYLRTFDMGISKS